MSWEAVADLPRLPGEIKLAHAEARAVWLATADHVVRTQELVDALLQHGALGVSYCRLAIEQSCAHLGMADLSAAYVTAPEATIAKAAAQWDLCQPDLPAWAVSSAAYFIYTCAHLGCGFMCME